MRFPSLPSLALRAVAILALLACSACAGYVSERFLLPRQEWMAEPSDLGLPFEEVTLATGPATSAHGWFVPAEHGDGRTVLLCHGNAANISFYHPYYTFLHDAGWNVLLFDYRGFGRSRGAVDVAALFSDTGAMLDHLLARPDVDRLKVAIYGISLGAIVALRTAARRPEVTAVAVEDVSSPDEAIDRSLGRLLGWMVSSLALPGGLEPDGNAARIQAPSLFLGAASDPDLLAHVRAFGAAKGSAACWVMPETGHAPNSLLVHDGEYQDAVTGFLDAAVDGRAPRIQATLQDRCEALLAVRLRAVEIAVDKPLPVQVCVVDERGEASFFARWMLSPQETWHLPFVGQPTAVTAWRYRHVDGLPSSGEWTRRPGPLAQAERTRNLLASAAGIVTGSREPVRDARGFVETLATLQARAPFPALLEPELVPSLLVAGRALASSPMAVDRAAARTLLQRCVAASPPKPQLHYWPAVPYVAGFRYAAEVEEAQRLLQDLGP